MVGLPGAGKTTFLAALWHVVEAGDVPGALRLEKLSGDREYLNRIRNDWVKCVPVERTVVAAEEIITLRLASKEAGGTELAVPDMSGESFRQQWSGRSWSSSYDKLVREADGVLLFVHPKAVVEPTLIEDADALVAALGGDEEPVVAAEVQSWHPEGAPTQVQLVDLLQLIVSRPREGPTIPVALIVSAWDLVEGDGLPPQNWVERRLPLLSQFLLANHGRFHHRIYGLSAQGGELPKDADRLLEIDPSKRIRIVGDQCDPHDVTAPISWLMSFPPTE